MSTAAAFSPRTGVASAPAMALRSTPGGSSIFRRMAVAGGDALTLLGVVFAIPFVIIAIGIPIAIVVQLVLWIARSI